MRELKILGDLGSSIAKGLITNNAITTLYLTKRNLMNVSIRGFYKLKTTNYILSNRCLQAREITLAKEQGSSKIVFALFVIKSLL